ncbi:MAG: hypothetical protein WD274_04410, partial [Acidimicrobiia bacterium]
RRWSGSSVARTRMKPPSNIHDLADPVNVLATMKEASGEDGYVLVMDEAVADAFGQSSDDVERLMYGFSLFVCLPDGMSQESSAGTGTIMRRRPCGHTPKWPGSAKSRCCRWRTTSGASTS